MFLCRALTVGGRDLATLADSELCEKTEWDEEGFDTTYLKTTPTGIATWRWDTLHQALTYYRPNYAIFDAVWDAELFKSAKSRKLESIARNAVHDVTVRQRTNIVYDITHACHEIRRWGSGCPCHEADRRSGKNVTCSKQGQRLPEASCRVKLFLAYCNACVTAPQEDQVCYNYALPEELCSLIMGAAKE